MYNELTATEEPDMEYDTTQTLSVTMLKEGFQECMIALRARQITLAADVDGFGDKQAEDDLARVERVIKALVAWGV
jgi:hypothetical protein